MQATRSFALSGTAAIFSFVIEVVIQAEAEFDGTENRQDRQGQLDVETAPVVLTDRVFFAANGLTSIRPVARVPTPVSRRLLNWRRSRAYLPGKSIKGV